MTLLSCFLTVLLLFGCTLLPVQVLGWVPNHDNNNNAHNCQLRIKQSLQKSPNQFGIGCQMSSYHQSGLKSTRQESNNDNEDSSSNVNNPEALQGALEDLFRTAGKTSEKQERPNRRRRTMRRASFSDQEEIEPDVTQEVWQQMQDGASQQGDGLIESDTNGIQVQADDNGLFLSEDDYVQASNNRLNPDGSLNLPELGNKENNNNNSIDRRKLTESLLLQHPNLPDSYMTSTSSSVPEGDPTLEYLKELQEKRQHDSSTVSEELHQSVFQNEKGYLQQSEIFRKSLGNDDDSVKKAAAYRRGSNYRQNLSKEINGLEREIEEFEASLKAESNQPVSKETSNDGYILDTTTPKCSKCGCAMSEEEASYSDFVLQQQRKQNPSAKPKEVDGGTSASSSSPPKRICRVCYGDMIVERSPPVSRNAELPNPAYNSNSQQQYPQNRPQQQGSNNTPRKKSTRPVASAYEKKIKLLEGEVQTYKEKAELAEQEIFRLRNTVAELNNDLRTALADANTNKTTDTSKIDGRQEEATIDEEGMWTETIDPDTGEVFYWNEETGEMKWDL